MSVLLDILFLGENDLLPSIFGRKVEVDLEGLERGDGEEEGKLQRKEEEKEDRKGHFEVLLEVLIGNLFWIFILFLFDKA